MPENDTSAPPVAPEQEPPPAPPQAGSVDLSVLKNFSFGPDWSATPSTEALVRKAGSRGLGRGRDGGPPGFRDSGPPRRDRRPPRPPAAFAPAPAEEARRDRPRPPAAEGDRRPPRRDGPLPHRGDRREAPPPFRPSLEVLFYPDDAAFRALTKAIRSSSKTFELFEIAHLLLQKPERFVIVLKPFPRTDGQPAHLFVAQPDHLPFESEDEAVAHVFGHHLDKFCIVEEVEVEPPKGNFVGVSKCGFTGELIGPPNYHRYPQLLREHHGRHLARMPFEKFTARLELLKEPEHLQVWLDKMKKATRYKLLERPEGAPEFFDNLDALRQHLLASRKDAIVRPLELARYSGKTLEKFAPGAIRRSVEGMLDLQRRFPLDTANNLRGRLRRMKFNLYKKGSKGVSYVCAVRRRFRDPQTVFAAHVQGLIEFIEKHPMVPVTRLAEDYLGFPPAPARPPAEAPPPAAAPAPLAEAAALPTAPSAAETPSGEVTPTEHPASSAEVVPSAGTFAEPTVEAAVPPVAEASAPAAAPAPAPEPAPAPAAPRADSHLTPEQQQTLRELLMNLRWLVSEGYVTEYSDGRLYAPPPLPPAKAKAAPGAHEHDEHALTEETPGPFHAPHDDEHAETLDVSAAPALAAETPPAAAPADETAPPPPSAAPA